jgi:hypothetical protein
MNGSKMTGSGKDLCFFCHGVRSELRQGKALRSEQKTTSIEQCVESSFFFCCHSGLDPESNFNKWIPAGVYPDLSGRE